jgi:hypothetical protein
LGQSIPKVKVESGMKCEMQNHLALYWAYMN